MLMDISAYAREVIEAGADDAGQLVDIILEQYRWPLPALGRAAGARACPCGEAGSSALRAATGAHWGWRARGGCLCAGSLWYLCMSSACACTMQCEGLLAGVLSHWQGAEQ
jgi:hypothetical protein